MIGVFENLGAWLARHPGPGDLHGIGDD